MSSTLESDEQALEVAMELHHRHISDEERRKFEGYVEEIFSTLGLDLHTPGTEDTARRHVQALIDVTSGYEGDPKLLTVFEAECRGEPDCRLSQVVEGPIPFYSLCEHHALPIVGEAYLAYISHEHIIGISKLTRLVRMFARRFTVQERLGGKLPTPWLRCSSRMEWLFICGPIICVRRCGGCGREPALHGLPIGAASTRRMLRCGRSSWSPRDWSNERPLAIGNAL